MSLEDQYVYHCPKCNFLAIIGGDVNSVRRCPKCGAIMTNTGTTKMKWDSMSKTEKITLIQQTNKATFSKKNDTNSESVLINEINDIKLYLKILTQNVGTIKTILMFYFVITLLGFLFVFLNALS